jgi:hypothetical protein
MADKVVSLKVVVDTATGTANVENLNEELKGTVEATEQTGRQSKKVTDDMSGNFEKVKNVISNISPELKNVVEGFNTASGVVGRLTTTLGILKGAILATGIGALVISLGALLTYFKRTEEGADIFAEKLAGIKSAINVLIDRFASFGKGVFQLFSGEFKKGWETLKGSLSGIGDEIARETKESMALTRALDELEDREIALIEVNARKEAQIAKLRLEAEDENKTNAERIKLLEEAGKLEKEIANEKISIAKERARIIAADVAQGQQTSDNLRKVAEANAEVIKLESERDEALKSLQSRINDLNGSQENWLKSAQKLTEDLAKEYKKADEKSEKALDEIFARQKQFNEAREKIGKEAAEIIIELGEIEETGEFEAQKRRENELAYDLKVRQDHANKLIEIARKKQENLQFYEDLTMQGIGIISNMNEVFANKSEQNAKKAFENNKKIQIAEALVSTYFAAQKAYASQIIPLDPTSLGRAQIAAAIATISGLSRVAKIKSMKYDSASSSMDNAGGISGLSGGTQSQSTGLTPLTPQSVRGRKDSEPVKVFVTETDIRAASGRVSDIQSKAVVK